jgi:four helix bundle protein
VETPIKSYRDLRVWQLGIELAAETYESTRSFPKDELFGMTSQLRRSAVAVPANIAEGFGRETYGAFAQFLRIAQGSLKEFETHVILACRVGLIDREREGRLLGNADNIGRMLGSLIRKVVGKSSRNRSMSESSIEFLYDQRPTTDEQPLEVS